MLTAPRTAGADEFHPGERLDVLADPISGRALVRFAGNGLDTDDWSLIGPDRVEIAHFDSGVRPYSHAVTDDGSFLVSGFITGGVFGYTWFRLDGTSTTIETEAETVSFVWPDARRPDLVSIRTIDGGYNWNSFDHLTGEFAPLEPELFALPTATADGQIVSYDRVQGIVRFLAADGSATDVVPDEDLDRFSTLTALGPNSAVFVNDRDGGRFATFVSSSGAVETVRISHNRGLTPIVLATSRPDEVIVVEHEGGVGGDHYVVQRIRSDGRRAITTTPTSSRSIQRGSAARVDDDNIWVYEGNDWTDIAVPSISEDPAVEVLRTNREPANPLGALRDGQPALQIEVTRPFELTRGGGISPDGESMLTEHPDLSGGWLIYDVPTGTMIGLNSAEVGRILATSWHEPSDSWTAVVSLPETPSLRRIVSIGRDGTIRWSRESTIEPNSTVLGVSRGRGVDDVIAVLQDTFRGQGVRIVNAFGGLPIEFDGFAPRAGVASDTARGVHLIAVSDEESATLKWRLVGGPALEYLAGGTIPALLGREIRIETVPQVAIDAESGIGVIVWGEHRPSLGMPWVRVAIVDLDDGSVVTNALGTMFTVEYRTVGVSAHDGLIQVGSSTGMSATLVELGPDGRTVNSSVNFTTDSTFSNTRRAIPVHAGDFQGLFVNRFDSIVYWTSRSSDPIDLNQSGYWMLGAGGSVYPFGRAAFFGDLGDSGVVAVDIEPTPQGDGYWLLTELGSVVPYGGAGPWGDPVQDESLLPGEKATALSATPTGAGYWVFTDKGNVLTFGDAKHYGDIGHIALSGPVIDAVASASGGGYYMVASDGGVFAFGDAPFLGSVPQVLPGVTLNEPVIGLAPTPDKTGYWLVAADGGVFSFNAPFRGSLPAVLPPGTILAGPVNGMVPYGDGYLLVGGDGGVFTFSDLPFQGSLGASPPDSPVVAIAPLD